MNPFSRTQFLLGSDAMEKLKKARVAVFGLGGVGGYVAEALARSGVGALDLVDHDTISLTNIKNGYIVFRKYFCDRCSQPGTVQTCNANQNEFCISIHTIYYL